MHCFFRIKRCWKWLKNLRYKSSSEQASIITMGWCSRKEWILFALGLVKCKSNCSVTRGELTQHVSTGDGNHHQAALLGGRQG
jgi:hypothetical protein